MEAEILPSEEQTGKVLDKAQIVEVGYTSEIVGRRFDNLFPENR